MGFKTEKQYGEWYTTLIDQIAQISIPKIAQFMNVSEKVSLPTKILAYVEFLLPKATVNFYDNQKELWAIGNFKGFSINITARSDDVLAKIICGSLNLQYPHNKICNDILSTLTEENSVECEILVCSMFSPYYQVFLN